MSPYGVSARSGYGRLADRVFRIDHLADLPHREGGAQAAMVGLTASLPPNAVAEAAA